MILEDVKLIASGLLIPEGPIAMPDGSVILVEIARGTLTRISAQGEVCVIADCGGGPNGAAVGPDGRVYICNNGGLGWDYRQPGLIFPSPLKPYDYKGGSIQAVDLKTGVIETLYTECADHPLRGPNDIVFDKSGNFWFTDMGKTQSRSEDRGGIYYASPDGSMIHEVIYPTTCAPNGIGLSPDGKTLYYAETMSARAIQREIVEDGRLTPTSTFSQKNLLNRSTDLSYFDSLVVDGAGNVCIATIGERSGITVFSADGKTAELMQLPHEFFDLVITNICFGGPDFRTAYITLSSTGRLISCRWPYPGLQLNY